MANKYTLYVDESGDPGIERIRNRNIGGASPYFSMGAVLIVDSEKTQIKAKLEDIRKRLGKKNLHCTNLYHRQKVYFSRTIQPCRMIMFSVLSLKETLLTYRDNISNSHEKYYNKCSQYLLEKVGKFLDSKDIEQWQVSIEFEDRGSDQIRLKNLLHRCRKNPIQPETKFLSRIDPDRIKGTSKN